MGRVRRAEQDYSVKPDDCGLWNEPCLSDVFEQEWADVITGSVNGTHVRPVVGTHM